MKVPTRVLAAPVISIALGTQGLASCPSPAQIISPPSHNLLCNVPHKMRGRNRSAWWRLCFILFSVDPVNALSLCFQPNRRTQWSGSSATRRAGGLTRSLVVPLLDACPVRGLSCGFLSAKILQRPTPFRPSPAATAAAKSGAAGGRYDASSLRAHTPTTATQAEQGASVPCPAGLREIPVPAADPVGATWEAVPITSLRTACRKLQLPSKGKRDELVKRLQAQLPIEKVFALLEVTEGPTEVAQKSNSIQGVSERLGNVAAKPKNNKCHVCNSRLSAKARFCSKCGATISTVGQETLKEFVEKAFWPLRLPGPDLLRIVNEYSKREQEVGSNTMRVERGFWQSILQVIGDVPVANLSAAVWEEYLRALKKRNCSPRTQVLHQVAYLAALKYAVHTRRLDSIHPFRKIRGCTKRTLASVPLTAEEVYLLLAATPNTMHCALFAVGIGAGLRPSEILSMRWEDVNMEEMTAAIRGSKTAASAAAIPLTNLASRELMRWWEEEGRPTSGLCFYAEGIRTASSRANLEKKTPIRSFKKALQAAAQRCALAYIGLQSGNRRDSLRGTTKDFPIPPQTFLHYYRSYFKSSSTVARCTATQPHHQRLLFVFPASAYFVAECAFTASPE